MNNSETNFITPDKPFQQRLENLPDEILRQKRFFEVGADKVPRLKGWSNPDNQKFYTEIEGYKGFDTTGHDVFEDYLFLDFDHIFNDKGEFVNVKAEKCFNYVVDTLKTYCELSVSLRGAHAIAAPTAGKFPKVASGKNGRIDLGDGACLEIFYKTGGRYCLFTGNVYRCEPKAPVTHGQPVDDVFKELLDSIQRQNTHRPHFDKFNTDRLQSARKLNHKTDAEPIGVSDSISPEAKRQERTDSMDDLMTTREVADFIDVSLSTVKNWRSRKLFGCYFFPADEKHGDTLYYKRERVEQLKSVYQFGILQNMYKLARLNPEATPPADFQKSDSSDEQTFGEELSFRHREFFTVDEVADYFGVTVRAVQQWVERGQLKEDMLGHNGDLYFGIDNVLNFTPPKSTQQSHKASPVYQSTNSPDFDIWRAKKMLEVIHVADLSREDWLNVGMALKNNGNTCSDWENWSRNDSRFKDEECDKLWQGFNGSGLTIGTICDLAKQYKYDAKAVWKEWCDLHPEFKNQIIHRPAQASYDNAPPMDDETTFTSRLDYLSSLPQSPDRDNQIIAQIRDQCDWKTNRNGERLYILPTFNNLRLIFDYDPNLQKLVGYDEFQGADVLLRKPPWKRADSTNTEWTDKDDAQLRLYLREHYGELQGKQIIEDMTTKISQANSFNVVKNFFKKLPEWDGQHRAETLFIKFLRVDDTPYAREVTWNWLLGAVARIFHPGCRYQTALVLHGNQKIGKSFIIECLGKNWYIELTDNVDDSHASDAIKKGWIVEIKEMAAMRKAEINAVKAFIERSSETRRAAYDRRATTTYRHCVFAITVNDSEFLRDVTGNRRYMILHCNSKMFDYVPGLTDDFIKQVWAEVFAKYNEMFDNDKAFDEKKLALSHETEIKAEEIATHFMQDDGMTNEIKGFLDKKIPPQFVWQELTREERRKFFEAGYIKLVNGKDDLIKRRQARGGKSVDDDVKKISDWLGYAGTKFVRKQDIKRGNDTIGKEFFIYGSDLRNHICAAEIFNECFGSDKRKAMYRINDILETLEGWTKGKRLQNSDTVYPDQKKPYYRNTAKPPVANSDTPAQADDDPSDLPF